MKRGFGHHIANVPTTKLSSMFEVIEKSVSRHSRAPELTISPVGSICLRDHISSTGFSHQVDIPRVLPSALAPQREYEVTESVYHDRYQ